MNPKPPVVTCPTCGKNVLWTTDNAWRPFCSERCKLIDLGAWATEKFRVPIVEEKDELASLDSEVTPPPAAEK
jgi:uncharacterized protein